MIKEFRYLKDFSNKNFIREMCDINDSMLEILMAIDSGYYLNKLKKVNELKIYIESLVNGQRQSLGRTIPGSWGLVPNDDGYGS